jgi:hypothetical protein
MLPLLHSEGVPHTAAICCNEAAVSDCFGSYLLLLFSKFILTKETTNYIYMDIKISLYKTN